MRALFCCQFFAAHFFHVYVIRGFFAPVWFHSSTQINTTVLSEYNLSRCFCIYGHAVHRNAWTDHTFIYFLIMFYCHFSLDSCSVMEVSAFFSLLWFNCSVVLLFPAVFHVKLSLVTCASHFIWEFEIWTQTFFFIFKVKLK